MKKESWFTWKDLVYFICLIALMVGLRMFVFSSITVNGASMDPTLQDREKIIGLKMGDIHRFDIVTFDAPDNPGTDYIKRVIGLPGETVSYENDQLYINGKAYDEDYLDQYKSELTDDLPLTMDANMSESFSVKVPEGSYFVLGDNRRNSKDSRFIGSIEEGKIEANAKLVIWPINQMGTL